MDLIFESTSCQAYSISVFVSTFLSTLLASGFRLCHYYSFTVIRLFFRCFAQQNLVFCALSLSCSFFVVRPSHQIKWQLNWRTFCAIWQALCGHKQAGRRKSQRKSSGKQCLQCEQLTFDTRRIRNLIRITMNSSWLTLSCSKAA